MTKIIDPRSATCLSFYKDPTSVSFGNLKQSARRAGFSEQYSNSITSKKPQWLTDNTVQDVKAIEQAEKNLRKYNDHKLPPEKIRTKIDIEVAKIQMDASKFILKTQARAKYSENKEAQTPNVQVNIVNYSKDDKKDIPEVHVASYNAQGEPIDVQLDTSHLDVPQAE